MCARVCAHVHTHWGLCMLSVCVSPTHMQESLEVRGEHQIPWTWNNRQLELPDMGSGNWTLVPCKSRKCSSATESSLQFLNQLFLPLVLCYFSFLPSSDFKQRQCAPHIIGDFPSCVAGNLSFLSLPTWGLVVQACPFPHCSSLTL